MDDEALDFSDFSLDYSLTVSGDSQTAQATAPISVRTISHTAPAAISTAPTAPSTASITVTPAREGKPPKKKRRVTVSDVQKVQIDVLELEKEKLKVEIENVKLIQQKLKIEVQEMQEKLPQLKT
jgi:hypothetical protein